MPEGTEPKHIPHKNQNIAYHMDWGFRKEAVIWIKDIPSLPNFYPLASDLRNWMLQKGDLRFFLSIDKSQPYAYSNPYTYDGSILAITYAQIINDSYDFTESTEAIDPTEAEIRRIRLYTENVLYTARICEAFIKQLLYCTTLPEGDYRGSALGSLLSKNCSGCLSSNQKRHKISLLGSLAHRYHLCQLYEKCINEHMKIVNRRRDLEAAHSGVTKFTLTAAATARQRVDKDIIMIGQEFIHMLQHISEIEDRMLSELNRLIPVEALRGIIARTVILDTKNNS